MAFEQTYDLPLPAAAAWVVVSDVERLVPCLPGASLESVDGADFVGKVAIKVGPIQVKYRGRGSVTERDGSTWTMAVQAAGSETAGTGTAAATVTARLEPIGATCRMHVSAAFEVTGTPARFGSGAMNEVAGRIVQKFATNLTTVLGETADPQTASAVPTPTTRDLHEGITFFDLLPASWVRRGRVGTAFLVGLAIALVVRRTRRAP